MTAELHAFFDEHPFIHVSTFGGAELGCVAALAVLDVVEAPGFLERVEHRRRSHRGRSRRTAASSSAGGACSWASRFDEPAGGLTATQQP